MERLIEIEPERNTERAVLVGVCLPGSDRRETEETMDELALLADTAGVEVVGRVVQERAALDPTYFIGGGKVQEVRRMAEEQEADAVIFDDDLSPAQLRNVERVTQVKVLDRSTLILDIFASHARSREARTQVELAQLEYLLPRLTRQWTHLSRQVSSAGGLSGGIGTRGPGETQLEVDRRAIRKRIADLALALKRIERQRETGRKRRTGVFKAALVGYTNAGKSTLMRALSGADVLVGNRLFSTLDSTTRSVSLGYNRQVLLTDTVGFIRKLPAHLVASFRSTLEEAVRADLLLHVVDVSHPACEEQIAAVREVLEDLCIAEHPALMVFNKIDRLDDPARLSALMHAHDDAVAVSGLTGEGIEELKQRLYEKLEKGRVVLDLRVSQTEGRFLSELYEVGEVLERSYDGNDVLLKVKLPGEDARRLQLVG
ncbi:MAG: GTPase HflX [Candidatus Handelsmanbacteria bacterium RIFCSPLOWO2_12_FULL_64_10]|uniref:GTPase HflX n=1 Tax=Handelsmanbacteria sp. (strain RIFCSPLOWO2_12_FULL_64_10) TaxID=1817868 RepID=A0A1F6CUR3_HANXR|nr:MAG: GTPase HflX [Candidatus Handelsmanbacteria bacterium RIFCSPLOWO2_12_FULL_64_10]